MTSRYFQTRHLLIWLAALAAVSISLTATAEPLKIRIQWSVAPAHLTTLITQAPKEIYKHYGKSYVVEPVRMRGSGHALSGNHRG